MARTGSLDDLWAHRLHLLAARRWRALGRPVARDLELAERHSGIVALTAPAMLRRVRDAVDGPLVVIKGPEVAAHYPDPVLRPFGDLDLLVADSAASQRALIADGFVPVGDPRIYEGIHHERPLALPGLPLAIELHARPKWPAGLPPPAVEELFEASIPSSTGVDGVRTLERGQHALVLAAHSWAHDPLRRLGEIVDVAAVAGGLEPAELRALAARWELPKVWRTTDAAASALLGGARTTWPLRSWARHLPEVRDRTVLESHLERWLSGFWALRPLPALAGSGEALADAFSPSDGETAQTKLSRVRRAFANAFVSQPRHVDELEREGLSAPLFYELEDREGRERPERG